MDVPTTTADADGASDIGMPDTVMGKPPAVIVWVPMANRLVTDGETDAEPDGELPCGLATGTIAGSTVVLVPTTAVKEDDNSAETADCTLDTEIAEVVVVIVVTGSTVVVGELAERIIDVEDEVTLTLIWVDVDRLAAAAVLEDNIAVTEVEVGVTAGIDVVLLVTLGPGEGLTGPAGPLDAKPVGTLLMASSCKSMTD